MIAGTNILVQRTWSQEFPWEIIHRHVFINDNIWPWRTLFFQSREDALTFAEGILPVCPELVRREFQLSYVPLRLTKAACGASNNMDQMVTETACGASNNVDQIVTETACGAANNGDQIVTDTACGVEHGGETQVARSRLYNQRVALLVTQNTKRFTCPISKVTLYEDMKWTSRSQVAVKRTVEQTLNLEQQEKQNARKKAKKVKPKTEEGEEPTRGEVKELSPNQLAEVEKFLPQLQALSAELLSSDAQAVIDDIKDQLPPPLRIKFDVLLAKLDVCMSELQLIKESKKGNLKDMLRQSKEMKASFAVLKNAYKSSCDVVKSITETK